MTQPSRSDRRHVEIATYVQEGPSLRWSNRDPGLVRVDWSIVGEQRFFVQTVCRRFDLLELDTTSYDAAILKAEELARRYGCGVIDRVADG